MIFSYEGVREMQVKKNDRMIKPAHWMRQSLAKHSAKMLGAGLVGGRVRCQYRHHHWHLSLTTAPRNLPNLSSLHLPYANPKTPPKAVC